MFREYRNGADRRQRIIPPIKYLFLGGRRKRIRRKEDEGKLIITDIHSTGIFALAVTIFILSITDGLLTLHLIGMGAYEVNPLMAYLIELNPFIYFFAKCFLTGFALTVLVFLKNYRSKIIDMRISNILPVTAIVFIFVIIYSLFIKFQLSFPV